MDENTFDMFKFLKLSRREAALHTPMIAGLLDPFGLHGLRDLFLGRFLESLSCQELQLKRAYASDYDWLIKPEHIGREHDVRTGRIDILLLCPQKQIAIAIENKIGSKESQNTPKRDAQLPRYLQWLRTLSPYFTSVRLYLLSPKGTAAETLPSHECSAISYETVLDCLLRCLEERPQPEESYIRSYAKTLANFPEVNQPQPRWARVANPAQELCNVFRFLRISRREDILHTPMLAGLLDPNAAHNQRSSFLSSFLNIVRELCEPIEQKQISESTNCDWTVKSEVKLNSGRVDILLDCASKGLLIAIENKIDARESENQIAQYVQELRMQYPEYPHQILVFLTITGSPPLSAGKTHVQQLSHERIRELVSEHHEKLDPGPVRAMVAAYLSVLKGIIPQPGTRSEQRKAVLKFLQAFTEKRPQLTIRNRKGTSNSKSLFPNLDEDIDKDGQYHGIYVWHEDLLSFRNRRILLGRVAINLSNKKVMGLYVGLRWNMRSTEKNESWRQFPEALNLLRLAEKIYKVPPAHAANHWFAICERLEYTRTDEGLVSILQNHESELHEVIASTIQNIWAFCGDRVLALNKRILSYQRV